MFNDHTALGLCKLMSCMVGWGRMHSGYSLASDLTMQGMQILCTVAIAQLFGSQLGHSPSRRQLVKPGRTAEEVARQRIGVTEPYGDHHAGRVRQVGQARVAGRHQINLLALGDSQHFLRPHIRFRVRVLVSLRPDTARLCMC